MLIISDIGQADWMKYYFVVSFSVLILLYILGIKAKSLYTKYLSMRDPVMGFPMYERMKVHTYFDMGLSQSLVLSFVFLVCMFFNSMFFAIIYMMMSTCFIGLMIYSVCERFVAVSYMKSAINFSKIKEIVIKNNGIKSNLTDILLILKDKTVRGGLYDFCKFLAEYEKNDIMLADYCKNVSSSISKLNLYIDILLKAEKKNV